MPIPSGLNAERVHDYLRNIPYPVTRQELIDYARESHAPDDVMRTLEELPEKLYASPAIVTETLGMLG